MSGPPKRTVALALAVTTMGALPAFLLGAVAVQVRRELGFGVVALGAAVSIFFVVAALGSPPLGRLGDRLGGRRAMRVGALMSATALGSIALFARSWPSLVACLCVGGLGNAMAQPAVNLFLARRIESARQGLVFGVKQAAIPTAIALSGLSVPVIALTVGWRFCFALAAVVAVAIAAAVPRQALSADRRVDPGPDDRLPLRTLVFLGAAGALAAMSGNALGAFHTASSVEAGIDEGLAGLLLALGSATALVVRVGAGWLADRQGWDGFRQTTLLLVGGAGGFALLAAETPLPLVLGTLLAFGAGWGWPGLFNFAVVSRNRHAVAAATGITQGGIYVGAALGPATFGLLASRLSFAFAWTLTAGLALVAGTLVAVARPAPAPQATARERTAGSEGFDSRLSLSRRLGPAQPAERPAEHQDGERRQQPVGEREPGRAARYQAAAGLDRERDRIDRGDRVDPALEQLERHPHGSEEHEQEDRGLHQRARLQRAKSQGDPEREQRPDDVGEPREPDEGRQLER